MNIAVTGASGFIGRYVLNELIRRKMKVIAVTRNATQLSSYREAIQIMEMDITYPHPDCFAQMDYPDVLIHLAWDGLPNYRSLHHFETELPKQYQFLKAMIESGLPSLLVTGTCFEYGMQSGTLMENLPANPGNPYSYAKDALRRQLEFLKSIKSFNLTWARLFYIYGLGQSTTSLYPQLVAAVSRGKKSFSMSGGEQLRDYINVTEASRLIVELAIRQKNAGLVNVCSGKPISVRKLAEGWISENAWDIQLDLGRYPYPDYEPMAFWGDRQKLEKIIRKD